MNKRQLKTCLKDMYSLLEEEKQALVKNEGHKIQDIVNKKVILLEQIEGFEGQISKDDGDIIELKKEIDSLQELNLLLTKQALSYQQKILESISENIKGASSPYSAKGKYEENENVNLINRKV